MIVVIITSKGRGDLNKIQEAISNIIPTEIMYVGNDNYELQGNIDNLDTIIKIMKKLNERLFYNGHCFMFNYNSEDKSYLTFM